MRGEVDLAVPRRAAAPPRRRARSSAAAPAASGAGGVDSSSSRAARAMRACGRRLAAASRRSRAAAGAPSSTRRTSSRGSSSSTVPTPVSTAPARLRQAWPSARAASPVIHWLLPSAQRGAAVERDGDLEPHPRPAALHAREEADVELARGERCGDAGRASRPRCRRRAGGRCRAPATSGFGSPTATTTRPMPASTSASQHGGVRPWCEHGSSVTCAVAPRSAAPCPRRARRAAPSPRHARRRRAGCGHGRGRGRRRRR